MSKTYMSELQRIAKTLLYCSLNIDERFPFIAHHPFFSNTIYCIQENGTHRMLNLANEDEFESACNYVKTLIAKTKSPSDFLLLVNKPYLPAFFKFAYKYMSEKDFSEFLAEMWVYVEFPNQDQNISVAQFLKHFQSADKKHLMSNEDYDVYSNFPDTIKVYRGIQKGGKEKALSWTTNYDTAEWFANRWSSDNGIVLSADISKNDVLAYFSGRGEYEAIVDFRKLKNITKVEV